MSKATKIEIIGNPSNEVREMLTGSLKWLRRLEERRAELPDSFFDNCDPQPLRKKIELYLNDYPNEGAEYPPRQPMNYLPEDDEPPFEIRTRCAICLRPARDCKCVKSIHD